MANAIIVFGSTMGNTETVADLIAESLNHEVKVVNVTEVEPSDIKEADLVLFGSSTWGDGELQEDFEDFIDEITPELVGEKDVAVFGCGDEMSYPDEFCAATDIIREKCEAAGANIVAENLRVDGEPEDSEDEITAWAEAL